MFRWLQTFPYFFKEALIDMRENRAVSVLAVATTTISLIFLGALWILQINVSHLISNWLERFQVAVFLRNDISPEQKNAVRKIIAGAEAVSEVKEITSTQALEEFRAQLGRDADVLKGLEKTILPSSCLEVEYPCQTLGQCHEPLDFLDCRPYEQSCPLRSCRQSPRRPTGNASSTGASWALRPLAVWRR